MTNLLVLVARSLEWVFFIGIAGCLVTIVLSWSSIFKEEFTSKK